jgi:plasmid stabilization system protein ParE
MVKKPFKIVWNNDAVVSFQEIIAYIKKDSKQGAEKVKTEILNSVSLLASNPEIFEIDKLKTNNDGSFRAFVKFHYRVSYQIEDKSILILSIRHTSREPLEY